MGTPWWAPMALHESKSNPRLKSASALCWRMKSSTRAIRRANPAPPSRQPLRSPATVVVRRQTAGAA